MNKLILTASLLFSLAISKALSQELRGEEIYAKISDAVVTIYTFDANGKILSQGSGVVLNDKGWVVTNYHVFAGADKLVVKHRDKVVEYTDIVGLDVEKDILILKIKENSFQPIKIGNSDSLKVGQKIYAIGSPLGFENTMTEGIISGLRHFTKETKDFIQISAAISPGSSGGAIVNTKGQLIAISTSTIKEGQNLNFAIPVNDVLAIYKNDGVKRNEIEASLYFYNGVKEATNQEYNAAITYFKKAIIADPNFFEAYCNLGYLYAYMEDFEVAIIYYNKAITINPMIAEAYSGLGDIYYSKDEHQKAIIHYKKAIAINPLYFEAYGNLGVVFTTIGDYDSAIIYCEKAIAINPESAEAYNNLGVVYVNKSDYETAIKLYAKSISMNPKYSEAYNNLGTAYFNKKEYELAVSYYKQAISIDPQLAKAYYGLALAYGRMGDINLKNYYLEKAYQLDPSLKK